MDSDFSKMLENQFLEIMPFNIAVIDRDFKIIMANTNFEKLFGEWKDKYCYEAYKKNSSPCSHCTARDVFATGKLSISDETGVDRYGRLCHYVVHLAPLKDESGKVQYIVEMSTDVTETNRLQREYNILFERAPCYITIIDREYRILRANEKFRDTFGDERGKRCFELYKQKKLPCRYCPAAQTFKDGKEHTFTQVGMSKTGEKTHYMVTTTPLSKTGNDVQLVIEIASDITELNQLSNQLKQTHDYYASLIHNSTDSIIALDKSGKTQIFNPSAKKLFNWKQSNKPPSERLRKMLPNEFFGLANESGEVIAGGEYIITSCDGESIPVWLSAFEMNDRKDATGRVAIIQDLREIKMLQRQMLDSERLGAVGETVAGLAHSIKNLLMSIEGGLYLAGEGLAANNMKRMTEGMDILKRNFEKTNSLVKDFLNFTKSKPLELKQIAPKYLVNSVFAGFKEIAKEKNIELSAKIDPLVTTVMLDPVAMTLCLSQLISNAIDAVSSIEGKRKVTVECEGGIKSLVFKVSDNGIGIEPEMLENIFTTYFTSKGNQGTGLGLLTSYRIVKEHGGSISVVSDIGKGTVFTLDFPLSNLNILLSMNK